jgi:hypothetical protein
VMRLDHFVVGEGRDLGSGMSGLWHRRSLRNG